MTQYNFDPPATVDAMQLRVGENEVDVADWVDQKMIGDTRLWRKWIMGYQFSVEIEGVEVMVDNMEYILFVGDRFHKMTSQMFDLFFSASSPG